MKLNLDRLLFSARRYSLTLISSFAGAIVAIAIVNVNEENFQNLCLVLAVLALGLVLYLAIDLLHQGATALSWPRYISHLIATVVLGLYLWYLLSLDRVTFNIALQYVLFNIALHLLISFVLFIDPRKNDLEEFWQFNRSVFTRFLLSLFNSAILFTGFSIALLLLKLLFKIEPTKYSYYYLFVIIAAIFNTWFFLSGIRANPGEKPYSPGLWFFTRFIIAPLVLIYLFLLYIYAFNSLFTWRWPTLKSTYLLALFSMPGILTVLLTYPLQNTEKGRWAKIFNRIFFSALIPLSLLMLACIVKRVSHYGITEMMYIAFVCGLWLAGISIYFLFYKKSSIKLIPMSLFLICFSISWGPWGVASVARRSQLSILENQLQKAGILKFHQFVETVKVKDPTMKKEMAAKISFLFERFGFEPFQPWFDKPLEDILNTAGATENETLLALKNKLGLEGKEMKEKAFNFSSNSRNRALDIRGFDYLLPIEDSTESSSGKITLAFSFDEQAIVITKNHSIVTKISLENELNDILKTSPPLTQYNTDHKRLHFQFKNPEFSARVQLTHISGTLVDNQPKIKSIRGFILLKLN